MCFYETNLVDTFFFDIPFALQDFLFIFATQNEKTNNTIMKYRFLSILSIPLLFITSCMDNTKETTSSNITDNEQTNIESENYNFSDFIKIFTTDSVFQINHIKFPLEYVSIELDEENNDSISTSYIKKSEWKYYSFPDTIYDGIKLKHPIDTTNFTYTELGVDTGVRIDYYFEKTGTQWLLTKIEDSSN